ncbi:hypothetical protein B0H15DRAFT_952032 [Mycena belliarum]|uniref:Uncharacterized protein n=1 Tax=Mycena belliarum TaxID=1033014 RepID=A0AAD6U026_9AGAR|nr:hypothetical protein B0H15DRAFT_952032 [Mycena belliae]
MPATQQSPDSSHAAKESEILLLCSLLLLVLAAFICVRRRRARTEALETSRRDAAAGAKPIKPLCHDIHVLIAAVGPTWDSIQPLAVQTPTRESDPHRVQFKHVGSSRCVNSRSNLSLPFSSNASLLRGGTPIPITGVQLQIAVLIAMPYPSLGSTDFAPDSNTAVGVAHITLPY